MALCSRDSRSFISKEEEEEIKSFTSQSSFYISFTNKVRLSAHRRVFLSIRQRQQQEGRHQMFTSLIIWTSFNTQMQNTPLLLLISQSAQDKTQLVPLLALQTGLFFLFKIHWGGEGQKGSSHLKSSSLGIQNLPANTSSGYFGTPHNTCSSLLAGSEWRGCCVALWWGVLLLLLHFLPLVWHSRSLNYVWTASNILYHQAPA